jgi:hypothetical protein
MESNNYRIAEISGSEQSKISELEKSLNSSSDKNIVLVAYQCSNKNDAASAK